MNFGLITALFSNPSHGWQKIKQAALSTKTCFLFYVVPLALIAPVSAFIGTTSVGWPLSGSETNSFLTTGSAVRMALLSYVAILVAVPMMAKTIHWMATTYDSQKPLSTCMNLATFTAIPLFIVGVAMLYPPLWFIYLLGLPALGFCVALLYSGVPVMMDINKEKSFLFSSAILALGLVYLVGFLVVTVSLWGHGFGPSFTH